MFKIFEDNPRIQFNANAVYNYLYKEKTREVRPSEKRRNIAKIRTMLQRLVKDGKIRRRKRGFYQVKPTTKIITKLENPDTKLHGIKLEFNIAENNKIKIHGISAQSNILSFLDANRFELVKNKFGTSLRRWSKGIFFMDRWVTITVHEKGLVEVFCRCGDNPLSFQDFVRFGDFLSGFFQSVMLFKSNEVLVRQVALNRDFWELNLDGVRSVTLHRFRNDWARVYQRHDGCVRFEHHLCLDITLDDAFNSLSLLTSPSGNGGGVCRPLDDEGEVMFS